MIFAGYTGSKNQVRTRQKIEFVSKSIFFQVWNWKKIEWHSIFQKSSRDRQEESQKEKSTTSQTSLFDYDTFFWKSIVPWRSLEENIWWSSKYKQKYFWNQSLPDVPNLPFGRWCGPVTMRWTSFWRSIGTFVHIHVYPLGFAQDFFSNFRIKWQLNWVKNSTFP